MSVETIISAALGSGGLIAAYIAWRADRVKGKRDELDLAALIREHAALEVKKAHDSIDKLQAQADRLEAQVADLRRGLDAAEQYVTQLLTAWHILLPHKDPPKPPPGLRMTTTKED